MNLNRLGFELAFTCIGRATCKPVVALSVTGCPVGSLTTWATTLTHPHASHIAFSSSRWSASRCTPTAGTVYTPRIEDPSIAPEPRRFIMSQGRNTTYSTNHSVL